MSPPDSIAPLCRDGVCVLRRQLGPREHFRGCDQRNAPDSRNHWPIAQNARAGTPPRAAESPHVAESAGSVLKSRFVGPPSSCRSLNLRKIRSSLIERIHYPPQVAKHAQNGHPSNTTEKRD